MGTEKGRSARLKAEKEAREFTRGMSASGFYSDATSVREMREYTTRKYAGLNERVSGRSHESHLPETRCLPTSQIKSRIGEYIAETRVVMGLEVPLHPSQCRKVTKKELNVPTPEEPKRAARKTANRDGRKRPNLANTTAKAKNTADPAIGRRAWQMMDAKTKAFVKLKSK